MFLVHINVRNPLRFEEQFFSFKKKNPSQVGLHPKSLLHSMCPVLGWEASWMGWLVLCVNLSGPGYPVMWPNIILDVSVEGVFG